VAGFAEINLTGTDPASVQKNKEKCVTVGNKYYGGPGHKTEPLEATVNNSVLVLSGSN
jgi:hypothetical protein